MSVWFKGLTTWRCSIDVNTIHLYLTIYIITWGRVTHFCVSKLTIIGSDNGLSPGRRQAIIWTNAEILLIRTLGTNFSEILGELHSFWFSKMYLKMSSAKWRLFGLGLNELSATNVNTWAPKTNFTMRSLSGRIRCSWHIHAHTQTHAHTYKSLCECISRLRMLLC